MTKVNYLPKNIDNQDLVDSYEIFSIEKKSLKSDTLVYFDTYDIIDMIQGIRAFNNNYSFNYNEFKTHPSVLIHSFAFNGYFGDLAMLPPHQDEFGVKLTQSTEYFPKKITQNYRDIENQFLYYLGLEKVIQQFEESPSAEATEKYISSLENRSDEIFKANYLLQKPFWKDRINYLLSNNKLILEEDHYNINQKIKTDLFKQIKSAFDQARPVRKMSKSNFIDALAFYFLQKKLDAYKKDKNKKTPLPIFFASSQGVQKAFKILRGHDPTMFCYQAKDGKNIPIIRDTTYFLLRAVLDQGKGEKINNYMRKQAELEQQINRIIELRYNDYRVLARMFRDRSEEYWHKFKDNVDSLVQSEFIRNVWLKNLAKTELHASLKTFIDYREKVDKNLPEHFEKETEKNLRKLGIGVKRVIRFSKIISALQNIEIDAEPFYNYLHNFNVYRDFALAKFGIDPKKWPLVGKKMEELLNAAKINRDKRDNDRNGLLPIVSEIMSYLNNDRKTLEEDKELVIGLVFLWVLEKYDLIIYLADDIHPKYPLYQIALIHGAAIAHYRANRIHEIPDIIDCMLKKSEVKDNYKAWIGLAWLYFRLWEKQRLNLTQFPELGENCDEQWKGHFESSEYKKYCLETFKYSEMVLEYLEKNGATEPGDQEWEERGRLYLFMLNNYIYYITKAGTKEQFEKIQPLYKKFRSYREKAPQDWQGRFFDTLAWYNFRKGVIKNNQDFINIAKSHNENAMNGDNIATKRVKDISQSLREFIVEYEAES